MDAVFRSVVGFDLMKASTMAAPNELPLPTVAKMTRH
jgi:hypothetical protein